MRRAITHHLKAQLRMQENNKTTHHIALYCSYLASLLYIQYTCTYCPKAANHAISPKTAVPLVTKDGILPLFKFRLILQTIVFIIGMFRSEYDPHKCGFSISRSITPNHGSDQPGLWTVASLSISRLFEWCLFTHCSWPLEKAGIKWLHLIPYQSRRVPI